MRYILLFLLMINLSSCKDKVSYQYQPLEGVEFLIKLKKRKVFYEHKATFLFFDLQIDNTNPVELYFDPSQFQAKIDNLTSKATYFDSLASVMPERKKLEKGKSFFRLYFVLPEVKRLKPINEFEVLNFGIDQGE